MSDYIYLLRSRLTPGQQAALEHVRQAARTQGATVFLVGGAVRDLTSGSPIRDLDVVVQGNALKLRKDLQKMGGNLIGENDQTQTLYFNFPGGVRLEVGSALSATYPKPGRPVYRSAGILEDLRRRDFTANAMAISLNEGSYGLLMDPLNGVADIENRELRLASNYGFIEDPVRLIRAARLAARLGWQMEEKTQQRYETGKAEDYLSSASSDQLGYELEEIFHEEDPLRVLRRLEAEGWARRLFPAWSSTKANEAELERLRDLVGQMEAMGLYPDPSAAFFPLLTAKLNPKEAAELKASFARPGFAEQIAALDAESKAVAAQLTSKAAAAPSEAWKMIFASAPEPVLWLAHGTRSTALQAKFKSFFNDWAQARQKIPYQLMQEMRITPELTGYEELLERLFFAIMDQKLETAEAATAFLEPFSPPAPPPPINLRRRAVKRETKAAKPRPKKDAENESETPQIAADGETAAGAGLGRNGSAAATASAGAAGGATKAAGVAPAKSVGGAVAKAAGAKSPVKKPEVKAAGGASARPVGGGGKAVPTGAKTAGRGTTKAISNRAAGSGKASTAGGKNSAGSAKKAAGSAKGHAGSAKPAGSSKKIVAKGAATGAKRPAAGAKKGAAPTVAAKKPSKAPAVAKKASLKTKASNSPHSHGKSSGASKKTASSKAKPKGR